MRLDARSFVPPAALAGLGLLLLLQGGPAAACAPDLPSAVDRALQRGTPVDPALVAADNGLGFALANRLGAAQPASNLVCSPLSVALALDMAYAGAAGATREAMAGALRLGPVAEAPEQANAALQAQFVPVDPEARLEVANSLWTRPGVALESFLALNRTYYGAFMGDLAGGADAVNAWAAGQTHGLVPALLGPGSDLAECDLFLANTVCFRGTWAAPFDPALSAPGRFTRRDGARVPCTFMNRTGLVGYRETDGFQAARLDYGSGRYGMLLLLPAPGVALEVLAAYLDPDSFKALAGALEPRAVQLVLPRFSCSYSGQLRGPLTDLGMGPAFDPAQADFSAMAAVPQAILAVAHTARIAVDERGTLAVAGTGLGMAPTSVLADPRPMVLDRPFLLAITDRVTGSVLFLGRVLDPSGPSGT